MAYRELQLTDRVRIAGSSEHAGKSGDVIETTGTGAKVRFFDASFGSSQSGTYRELWFNQRNLAILSTTPIKDPVPQVKEKAMTPVQHAGFKIGDKFRVHTAGEGFTVGTIIQLERDDGSSMPLFKGQNAHYRLAGPNRNESGAYMRLSHITKVDNSTPLTGAGQPEIKRFKAGDKVKVARILGNGFERNRLGKIGTVTRTDHTVLPVLVRFDDGSMSDWGRFDELDEVVMVAVPAPVARAEEVKAATLREKLAVIDTLVKEVRELVG